MSDLTSIQSIMQGKEKENLWIIIINYNIGHIDLQIYEVTRSAKQNKYPKCDACLLDRARDIRQNHWIITYRSQ